MESEVSEHEVSVTCKLGEDREIYTFTCSCGKTWQDTLKGKPASEGRAYVYGFACGKGFRSEVIMEGKES